MIYVVHGLKSNLLGFPTIQNLRLFHRVYSVSKTDAIKQQFAAVVKELGTLGESTTQNGQEVHPVAKVDDILGKLAGATIFSNQQQVSYP